MKKIVGILMTLSMILVVSSAYAADGDTVTVSGTNVGGGNLVFIPSPSTSMLTATTATDYNILSWSNKNLGKDAGMEYLATSSSTGIFQAKIGATARTSAGTAGTTIDGFVQKK